MKPYSEDLRTRIVKAVREGGMPKSGAARLFGVSLSSVKRYARIADRGASLEPRKGGGRPPKVDEAVKKLLEGDAEKRPAATVPERRRFLEQLTGKSLGSSTIRRAPKRLGFSQKNGAWGGDGARRMVEGRLEGHMVAKEVDPARLVFVDEMGANTRPFTRCTPGPKKERGPALLGAP